MFKQSIFYFISVVEEGGFSGAGKKHYLSQSAISQQMTKLENELGFRLFDRHAYRPTLTNEGKAYYQICKKLVEEYQVALNQIHNTIVVGITGPFEKKHIPQIMKKFKSKHNVEFDVRVLSFQECVQGLKNRELDVGFGLINDFEHEKELKSFRILKSHVCIVTALDHHLSQKEFVTIQDIQNEPIVVLSKKIGTYYYDDFMRAFELDGVKPQIIKEVDNLNEYIVAIQLGEGIGLSAKEVISDNDEVATVLLKNTHHCAYYAVGYHQDNLRKDVLEFVRDINNYFEDYKKNL